MNLRDDKCIRCGRAGHEARSGPADLVSCDGVITILQETLLQHYRHSGLMPGNEGDSRE